VGAEKERSSGWQDEVHSPQVDAPISSPSTSKSLAGEPDSAVSATPTPSPPPLTSGSGTATSPALPPKPTAPQSPRNLRRSVPSVPQAAVAASSDPLVTKAVVTADSPRILSVTDVTAAARAVASGVRVHLDNILVDSSSVVEFDVAIKTGKVLMQVCKMVMGFMGWTEMPTNGTQQVPVVELSALQERFLPESKHAMFIKLVQAFSSAVQDIHSVLDEALFVLESGDEIVKWRARESELTHLLQAVEKVLQEQREVIAASLSKEDEFFQVMELGDMLRPVVVEILAKLSKMFDGLDKETPERVQDLCGTLSSCKVVLEGGEANKNNNSNNKVQSTVAEAKVLIAHLNSKFSGVLDALKGVSVSSKGLLTVTSRARQVNALLP
jgi:hypothetical protein